MKTILEFLAAAAKVIPPLAAFLHDVLDGDETARSELRAILPARHGLHEFVEKNTPPSRL